MHQQVALVEEEVVFDGAEVSEEILLLQHQSEQPLAGVAVSLGGEGQGMTVGRGGAEEDSREGRGRGGQSGGEGQRRTVGRGGAGEDSREGRGRGGQSGGEGQRRTVGRGGAEEDSREGRGRGGQS